VRESFHGAGRIAGWVTSGEVPLRAGGGCHRIVKGNLLAATALLRFAL